VFGAEPLEDAARALARKIIPAIHSGERVRLTWRNESGLARGQSEFMRQVFSAELAAGRVSFSEDVTAVELQVSLHETPAAIVLTASIVPGDPSLIRLVSIPRSDVPVDAHPKPALRLQKVLLLQEREPILAAAETPDATRKENLLLVLDGHSLALYRAEPDRWSLRDSVSLEPGLPPSRDPHGAILLTGGGPQVLLEDRICDVHLENHLSLACHALAATGGAMSGGSVDGLKLASCNSAPIALVAGSGDWSVPDQLQPVGDHSSAFDSRVDFPGPILSLSGAENLRANAVIFNLTTGNYEVYRVTLACSD
jgi:hypothetical protein